MKKLIQLSGIVLIAVLLHGCDADSGHFVPADDMVKLSLTGTNEVKVGQICYVQAGEYGSVGTESQATIENGLLKALPTHFSYDHPDGAEMAGGDAGTITHLFEALSVGETSVTLSVVFRGDVTDQTEIKIRVVEAQ